MDPAPPVKNETCTRCMKLIKEEPCTRHEHDLVTNTFIRARRSSSTNGTAHGPELLYYHMACAPCGSCQTPVKEPRTIRMNSNWSTVWDTPWDCVCFDYLSINHKNAAVTACIVDVIKSVRPLDEEELYAFISHRRDNINDDVVCSTLTKMEECVMYNHDSAYQCDAKLFHENRVLILSKFKEIYDGIITYNAIKGSEDD